MDWDDLRTFLAIARYGTLSAAARAMGLSQTTVARRLDGLHRRAGAVLVQRTPTGFVLTQAGSRILANIERMESEALTAERAISGEDCRLEGLVRITTVNIFAHYVVAPALGALRRRHPGIAIELNVDNRALSLSRREADIALRLARFEQHEVIVRKVAELPFGIYAAESYLEARGRPDFTTGCAGHDVLTVEEEHMHLPEAIFFASLTAAAAVALQSGSRHALAAAAVSGLGLVCLPRFVAEHHPGLVRLPTRTPEPVREVWLGVHRDIRHTPRIRAVIDFLVEWLGRGAG